VLGLYRSIAWTSLNKSIRRWMCEGRQNRMDATELDSYCIYGKSARTGLAEAACGSICAVSPHSFIWTPNWPNVLPFAADIR